MPNKEKQTTRESFQSRLGFILLSAGCAIGIGNVWRFPYVAGNNGGGLFVLFYIFFLIVIGVPILTMEFAIGRKSQKSIGCAYNELEKPGQKWHLHGYLAVAGNYLLMFFYTTVSGWMLYYFYRYLTGTFEGMNPQNVEAAFDQMLTEPATMAFWMLLIVALGFAACSMGLQKGVERVTKFMMLSLLFLIIILASHSLTLPGAADGVRFYLFPASEALFDKGVFSVLVAAMNQAFFTLSLGIGSMMIFGSYLNKKHTLMKESLIVASLDTFVAIIAGLIIFPACFSFGIQPGSGPKLVFITLPNTLNSLPAGRIWGSLFFLFMTFASLSTVIAVFENIIRACMDIWGWSRKNTCVLNCAIIAIGSLPCVLGFNILSKIQPLGEGSTILDFEDFLVSNLLLPSGALIILLFCTSRYGWGFKKYLAETNQGSGLKMPKSLKIYLCYILPALVFFMLAQGLWNTFAN